MISIWDGIQRNCAGVSRRRLLEAGTISAAGHTLTDLYLPQAAAAANGKSCIFIFLWGGPPQHETFDPKPDAPSDIRGEFKPIDTNVPGVRFCELLPRTARHADK